MRRKSGVLLNVSSLMGEYGIGGFSKNTLTFFETMLDMSFKVWQVLPITTIGLGNSPYSGVSAFAGNYLYIDPDHMPERLLTRDERVSLRYNASQFMVDYEFARYSKRKMLELAFPRLNDADNNAIDLFLKKNQDWVMDYAVYRALKEHFAEKPWYQWDKPYRTRTSAEVAKFEKANTARIRFYIYEQYEFFRQWDIIKKEASLRGIQIFGDMPIYVSLDSVDVWAHPQEFLLDAEGMPTLVAGVPPDYFSADGQLWGNPIYNYEHMKTTKYEWLIKRIEHNLKLYDILRIDHFRGLVDYWAIPASATSARLGSWKKGPGMDLWKEFFKKHPNPPIIAEDLGIIDDKVRTALRETGFYGMRVLQFAFDGDPNNTNLPHNYVQECVAYTGTHDNNTSLGWLYEASVEERERALAYVGFSGGGWGAGGGRCESTKALIKAVIGSVANLAIIPLQDLCGYGADTRLNRPGVPQNNWTYRATLEALNEIDTNYMHNLNSRYGRA